MIAYEARESCLPGRGAVPTARGIRVDTKVSTLMNPVSFWDSTAKFAELRLAKERQRIFPSVSFSTDLQCQIPDCYTGGLISAGCGITVPHDSLASCDRQGLRKINYTKR